MSKDSYNPRMRYEVLRRSQFIGPFGVGSIVDLPEESLMPAGTEFWHVNAGPKIYDQRLQARLGVKYFKMPPSGQEYKDGIPFVRFPKWLFCPNCRLLRHIDDWTVRYTEKYKKEFKIPRCDICHAKLVPSRFIVVCEKGHVDDFPWVEWAHRKGGCFSKHHLKIETFGSASGLSGIKISCTKCGNFYTMDEAFKEGIHTQCSGYKPWVDEKEVCDSRPKTVQRGASNVYFPLIINSIVIPPYSDNLISDICGTSEWDVLSSQDGGLEEESFKEVLYKRIAKLINRDFNEVKKTAEKLLNDDPLTVVESVEINYRYDEYKAFQGFIDEGSPESKNFKIQIRDGKDYKIPGIEKVVQVHRLREVRALYAFSRLTPLDRNDAHPAEEDDEKTGYAVYLKNFKKKIDWLPAVEVYGEGIFIMFNTDELSRWAQMPQIEERVKILNDRYYHMATELKRPPRKITATFVFLHTFAHLLIRQLSFECGYGSASLRERIYCNETDDQPLMAGILVYTASGDSEGTMGGLVRQGKPEFLGSVIKKAVNAASWCSSDPLCFESTGQGLGSLNLAACHACALLPETCCEEFNRLLDRALVVGLPDQPEMGFLSKLNNLFI
ncbi:DUF1998 domain-containing protein [Desulforamulus hydrothermalis]|uniref:MrfA-like Zn-binding domain-containing protein n=1 Tax=Desulforamulus hydrothermalis Lam5 = DSM 18033 TaxID=1121428 RepID=K8DYP7_9FIRM|nr:DUF1998 domain-containing protein [Desulforamulus hydrothermalis]CCO08062.1 conserved hypothetical protein [Desulforamulus hydrothermalis Lam5 = DSM 18033]SHG82955.1 protein of unknown function [Desulforamulus hydrothermalis Lam5 = DSM 18033]